MKALEKPPQTELFTARFFQEVVKQVNVQEHERYSNNYQELLFQSFKPKEHQIDSLTQMQVSAFYHTIATILEEEIGKPTEVFINLNSQGLSSALVCCGNLVVIKKISENLRYFEFNSLEELSEKGIEIIAAALGKASQYFDLPSVIYTAA